MTSPIPGPYFIDEDRAAICSRCERTGEVLTLCMFTEWGDLEQAVARAIVSRLDVLAALREITEFLEAPPQYDEGGFDAFAKVGRDAITRAEGRA